MILAWVQKLFGSEGTSQTLIRTDRFDDFSDDEIRTLEKATRDLMVFQSRTALENGFGSEFGVNEEDKCRVTYLLWLELSQVQQDRMEQNRNRG